MALDVAQGFDYARSIFVDVTYFNIEWIMVIIAVFFTMLIITRDSGKWKVLAFPTTILWHIAGLSPSILWYIATVIMFVNETIGLETIGNIITAKDKKPQEVYVNKNQKNVIYNLSKYNIPKEVQNFLKK